MFRTPSSGTTSKTSLGSIPTTPILIDLFHIAKRQSKTLETLRERGFLSEPFESSLLKYLRKSRQRPPARLIVSENQQSGDSAAQQLLFTIDLSPMLTLSVEAFPDHRLAYAGAIELPERSRPLHQAKLGTALAVEVEKSLFWHVVNSQRPLSTKCHVCSGSGRVACSRCQGRGWYLSERSRRRYPCGAENCRRGKVPCYYCKGTRLLSLGILRQDEELWVRAPKAIQHDRAIPLLINSKRIKKTTNPLFTAAEKCYRSLPRQDLSSDPLFRAESRFKEQLQEMREFLKLELENSIEEIESLKVTEGFIVQRESSKTVFIQFSTETDVPSDWRKGRTLLLLEHPLAEPLVIRLEEKSSNSLRVQVKAGKSGKLLVPNAGILITRSGLKTVQVQREALSFWKDKDILHSPVKRTLCLPKENSSTAPFELQSFFNQYISRNKSQRTAVEKAVSGNFPILCIQGPPGTGKTSVICEIVRQELQRGAQKILISSQSNLAVDNVLERLINVPKIKLLRLGNREKVQDSVKPLLKEKLFDSRPTEEPALPQTSGWFSKLLSFTNKHFSAENKALKQAQSNSQLSSVQVVGATCIGSADPFLRRLASGKGQRSASVDLVIIDEAGRSTPMETLVPMQFAERIILVGDHRQLPPVLNTELRESWRLLHPNDDIEKSIGAESLFEQLLDSLSSEALCILDQQFRMHSQIGSLVASVFYEKEKLRNAVDDSARELPLPNFPSALSYHSTKRYGNKRFERTRKGSMSKENPAEADLVLRLLRYLDQNHNEESISVGVISFYSAQAKRIHGLAEHENFHNLDFNVNNDISTLDAFQGKEKDIIILSLVRCPAQTEHFDAAWFKFFLDVRRLNVALSRSRRRLLIVGDIEQILRVHKNREDNFGFTVLEKLFCYIQEHCLEVHLQ